MQVVDGVDDAGHVEARGEVVEPAAVAQDRPQLPAQAGLHQEVHVLAVFERAIQTENKQQMVMVLQAKNYSFCLQLHYLVMNWWLQFIMMRFSE